MVVLFSLVALVLAACGFGLVGLGVGMLAEGQSAGAVGVICGLPVCYGAYLFARAAIRVRRNSRQHPLSEQQRSSRQRKVGFYLAYTASLIVGAVTLPVPTIIRVVMVISALLVLPVMLAREFEPAKKHN